MKKIIAVVLSALLMTGCSENGKNVATDGSTSMEKVIGALGEAYEKANPEINFTYNPTGSGAGIIAVAEGGCHIGLSSRRLKEDEKALGLRETFLAYDGIAIIVNPQNPAENLTTSQIKAIYTGEITRWSGTNTEIVLVGREAGSGTRLGFEAVTDTENACKYRQELTSSGDVIATVAQNPNAIGYTSVASVKGNVKILSIDGIAVSEATIKNGEYALQRPFVLVTKTDTPLPEAAQNFFDYATSEAAADIIRKAGVIPNYYEEKFN